MAVSQPRQSEMPSSSDTSKRNLQSLTKSQQFFLGKYSRAEFLMAQYTPDLQAKFSQYPTKCLMGNSPTLADMRVMYGERYPRIWLENQIRDLGEFTAVKEKPSIFQIQESARIIMEEFYYLKLSEFMLFFAHFKAGRYGRFFGSVDPIVITDALQSFKVWRASTIEAIERAAKAEELAKKPAKDPESLTREEWEELKWMFNLGYEKDENGKIR